MWKMDLHLCDHWEGNIIVSWAKELIREVGSDGCVAFMIQSQLMGSRNLAAFSLKRHVMGNLKATVIILQSPCLDLSQPGNILAIII